MEDPTEGHQRIKGLRSCGQARTDQSIRHCGSRQEPKKIGDDRYIAVSNVSNFRKKNYVKLEKYQALNEELEKIRKVRPKWSQW